MAQLNIKLREVTAELDEAHAMYSQHSAAGSHSTEGERGSGGDEEEHIYEEPPEEVNSCRKLRLYLRNC